MEVSRRDVIKGTLAAAAWPFLELFHLQAHPAIHLVPFEPKPSLSYWCSWGTQISPSPDDGSSTLRNLNETNLFENPGWISRFYDKVRGDLIVVLDEGWDVPLNFKVPADHWQLGSLELSKEKFPSFNEGSPPERLKKLNEAVRKLGWAGVGLWIAAQLPGDGKNEELRSDDDLLPYWRERSRWCAEAEIAYWKVDWGARSGSMEFHEMLSRLAREESCRLRVEHAALTGPVNEPNDGSGRYTNWTHVKNTAFELLSFTDVLRGYDVSAM